MIQMYPRWRPWGDRYHMHIEPCLGVSHTFEFMWINALMNYVNHLNMCLMIGTWWTLVTYMHWWTWWNVYLISLFFVILVQLVILINDAYFGENNEVWIICMWFNDLLSDNDFLAYTFKMMNCICWVDYAKWGIQWLIFVLVEVVKWWAYVDDLIIDWICLLCNVSSVIVWHVWNKG